MASVATRANLATATRKARRRGLSYRRSDFPGRTKAEHAQAIEALRLEAFDRTVRDNDDRLFETITIDWCLE
jgi:hypothetical protein